MRVTISLRDQGPGALETKPVSSRRGEASFAAVSVKSDNELFDQVLARSFEDLRMLATRERGETFFAAGVPWFVCLFGRDSLVTALQTLAYDARVAADTLLLLAKYQGRRYDEWRDEEPGKILHELRVDEKANLNEVPQTPYYGTIDATPLFICLLAEYVRWTGDLGLFHRLRSNVERALWPTRAGRTPATRSPTKTGHRSSHRSRWSRFKAPSTERSLTRRGSTG